MVFSYINKLRETLIGFAVFFFFILFGAVEVNAQKTLPMDMQTGKYYYSKVIFIDSTTKEQLFERAQTWFNNHFETEDSASKTEDFASGKLSGNGSTMLTIKKSGIEKDIPMYYTLNIFVKGSRCKFEFTDIVYKPKGEPVVTAEKMYSGKISKDDKIFLSRTKKAIAGFEKTIINVMTDNQETPIVKKYKSE